MTTNASSTGLAVPSRRLGRLWHLGRATTDLAAGIGVRGMIDMARNGGRTDGRIQLSPAATKRFTDRLARMRGAVMKVGQLMSMDGTDVFTPEAAEIMATLRDRAEAMPMSQLNRVLTSELGRDWNKAFRRFEFQPIAAASIGQVHRAETRDGRRLALKIQFPGVRESIDSDIDNLGFLARNLGMMPKGIDPQPLLDEARVQLHREADYEAEAASMMDYRALVGEDADFFVPRVHADLSTSRILAMDFADGVPIDRLADGRYRQAERERAATLLTRLMLRELFEFGLAQTDPNFGNFLYDADSGRIVLLDFGATNTIPSTLAESYRLLSRAALEDDAAGLRQASVQLGYIGEEDPEDKVAALIELIRLSSEIFAADGPYDFGTSNLFERVYTRGRDLFLDDAFTRMPDPSSMFLHRKFVGVFMLCRRLRARIDFRDMLMPYLSARDQCAS
ncbi:AarF/ABC1/UbiB kinase family protein [Thiohalocapsa marina]|uniref:AarF/ABC1/UbiB kinase family protein n=1 Tax=Thiohalocapsa marina TaxID=424902 RepID=A0A5M8FQ25_9GAMM|nr:AarF/ABC1/UbiB kinase family protein [Thiohalocapsa marina]KAA6185806.1 AarF/ABC1/UbiB kinase family protein [Thiohalocapsa marina]